MPAEVRHVVELKLPHLFDWRSYQAEFWNAMRAGCLRAALVWHRRAGKDLTVLNWTIHQAVLGRPGTYFYFFPTYNQGRKILWDGMDARGIPFLARIPRELIGGKNETEMQITLRRPDGQHSIFQIIGTDKMDSIVGTNPIGCVYSEYSLQNPRAWNLTRPILAENGGWAAFVYTPRGKNWGWDLWKVATSDPSWFTSLKTVDDTRRDAAGESGERVVPPDAVEAERRAGMPEELIQQEFYCSFEGALVGAYYADQIKQMREQGRIRPLSVDPIYPVETAWDLGVDDETAIVFTQQRGDWLYWVDFYANSGAGLEHYAAVLREKRYYYGAHYGPHDIKVRDFSTGNTRLQHAQALGINFRIVPKLRVEDRIQALRRLLPRSIICSEKCARLVDALSTYRREFDEETQTFRNQPVHDWASHPADAAGYRAIAYHEQTVGEGQRWADTRYRVWAGPAEQDEADGSAWSPLRGLDRATFGSPFDR